MIKFELIREQLVMENEDALLADGLDEALIGICHRFGQPPLATYDKEKVLNIFMERDKMAREEAIEFVEYNVVGAWMGESTPVFIDLEVDKEL